MDANGRLYLADATTPVEDIERAREHFASLKEDEMATLDRLRVGEGQIVVPMDGLADECARIAGLL